MEQLELFLNEPFCLRISIPEALGIFWNNYWCHLACASTTKAHFKRLSQYFKSFYLETVSKADVERFRRHMEAMGYKAATVNKAHMILSRLYSKFEEYKEGRYLNGVDLSHIVLPAKNPAAQVPKVDEKQFADQTLITKEQKVFLCDCADRLLDQDLCEIIDTLYWSQLRQGDLFNIKPENVDLEKMVIIGVQGKLITSRKPSGYPYKVPIPKSRIEMIKRRVEETKQGDPIFKERNLQKRWKAVRKLANMPWAKLKHFRGAANSFLLDENFDIETVRKKGGWTTTRMIPHYDKRPDDKLIEATERLVEA